MSFKEIETENLETGEHTFGVFTEDDKFTGPLNISGEA